MLARGLRATGISLRQLPSRGRLHPPFQPAFETHVGILRRPVQTRTPASILRQVHGSSQVRLRVLPLPSALKSSSWSFPVIIGATLAAAILLHPFFRDLDKSQTTPAPSLAPPASTQQPAPPASESTSVLPRTPSYSEMPTPPGHIGNLTPEQELKLRDFWAATLKTFGVKDPDLLPAAAGISATTPSTSEPNTDTESPKSSKKTSNSKKRHSLFSSKKHQDDDSADTNSAHSAPGTGDEDDKYGQTKEFHQTLKELTPEELRSAFWSMVKSDHPDALLLRFLRARKWDVQRALVMLISTMRWRCREMHVDDDIMYVGEGGALADAKSGDGFAKKEGGDFMTQMRKGKSYLHGMDREGRPLCYVNVRLHKQGEQSDRTMERYTVLIIETARLLLKPPVETATIVFDMTSFTLSNMDYAPLKFMIKIFEANYPESLGAVLVHKAPWVFQGIWSIIKNWLDPVVAAKVHFTKSVDDLEVFIPRAQIVRELGGDEEWAYRYVEPVEGEDGMMEHVAARQSLEGERSKDVQGFQEKTFAWLAGASNDSAVLELGKERDELAKRLNQNYWMLDPYIRARSLYDRQGVIGRGGAVDFYPEQRKSRAETRVNGVPASGAGVIDPSPAVDDVD